MCRYLVIFFVCYPKKWTYELRMTFLFVNIQEQFSFLIQSQIIFLLGPCLDKNYVNCAKHSSLLLRKKTPSMFFFSCYIPYYLVLMYKMDNVRFVNDNVFLVTHDILNVICRQNYRGIRSSISNRSKNEKKNIKD